MYFIHQHNNNSYIPDAIPKSSTVLSILQLNSHNSWLILFLSQLKNRKLRHRDIN